MRRRLRMTYVGLLAVVVLGLAVPLALALAGRAAQSMYIDRLNDAAQFASQAEPAIRTGRTETLKAELDRYDESFGIGVAVVGRDGAATLASRSGLEGAGRTELDLALAGRQAGLQRSYWPWQTDPMVVALPINRDQADGLRTPRTPRQLKQLDTGQNTNDPWGQAYNLNCSDDEVTVLSNGPDKKKGTKDDIAVPKGATASAGEE